MDDVTGRDLYTRRMTGGGTWEEIGAEFGISGEAARKREQRYRRNKGIPPANVTGGLCQQPPNNGRVLWDKALQIQDRQEQDREWRASRRIVYDSGPVVIVFMADLHLGSAGTDYRAIDHDITIINDMTERGVQVGVVLLGDLLDNFIVGRLRDLRMNQSPFLTIDEWGLVDYALERLAPTLVGSVAGNHDNWSWAVVGVDLLRERHNVLTPGILYDPLELSFTLQVGSYECRVICRHDWRGHSFINPTHGMEHGQHTLGREADIRVGAHTHRGGLAREIANGKDMPGHALICGTYKKVDTYAMAKGYPPPLKTSSVAVVVCDDGIAFSTSRLGMLTRFVA